MARRLAAQTPADNLAAIAATLEAMRAIERHGGAEILDRAFTGFTALPAPSADNWRVVLAVNPGDTADAVTAKYRQLRSIGHPDKGGNTEQFNKIERAYQAFLAERAQGRGIN